MDGEEELCFRHVAPEVEPAPVELLPGIALRIVGDSRAQRVLVLIAIEEDAPASEEIGKGADFAKLLLDPTVPIPLIEAFVVVADEWKSLEVFALEGFDDIDFYLGVSCHCGRGAEVISPVAKFLRHISVRVLTVEWLFRDFLILFEIARPAQSRPDHTSDLRVEVAGLAGIEVAPGNFWSKLVIEDLIDASANVSCVGLLQIHVDEYLAGISLEHGSKPVFDVLQV